MVVTRKFKRKTDGKQSKRLLANNVIAVMPLGG